MMTDRKYNIYVGRIDTKVSKAELGNLFRPYGKVNNVFIASPMPNALFTYGFVLFENGESASVAIDKLNGIFFHGQRLRVEPGSERDECNKTHFQNHQFVRRRPWNSRPNEPRNVGAYHQSNFNSDREEQLIWNGDLDGRNEHLSHLTNIYSEVSQSPLLPDGGATLPDLVQWLTAIDRLPLANGPVFGQKKPQCFLDLDALDDLSEK